MKSDRLQRRGRGQGLLGDRELLRRGRRSSAAPSSSSPTRAARRSRSLLGAVVQVFEDFRYTDQVETGDAAVLVFRRGSATATCRDRHPALRRRRPDQRDDRDDPADERRACPGGGDATQARGRRRNGARARRRISAAQRQLGPEQVFSLASSRGELAAGVGVGSGPLSRRFVELVRVVVEVVELLGSAVAPLVERPAVPARTPNEPTSKRLESAGPGRLIRRVLGQRQQRRSRPSTAVPGRAPVSAAIVGARSMFATSCVASRAGGKPGPRMINGTRSASS